MERIRASAQYAALGCKRCAALLVTNEKNQEEWRIYANPTIGEIQSLRRKGAVIMRRVSERYGNQVDHVWITDSGIPVVISTEFLR